jgi:hypothetical protein
MKTTLLGRGQRNVCLLLFVSTFLLSASSFAADPLSAYGEVLPAELATALERDFGWTPDQARNILRSERELADLLASAAERLGDHYGGSWIEHGEGGTVRAVIASTSSEAGRVVIDSLNIDARSDQAELRVVRYSLDQLNAAIEDLNRAAGNPLARDLGDIHSWGVDVQNNRIVVVTAPNASDRALDFVAASRLDLDMLDFEVSEHHPSTLANIVGGFRYNSCSIGFAVRQGSTPGFVTAGHCGTVGTPVRINGVTVGHYQRSNFPGADAAWANVRPSDNLYNLVWMYSGNSTYAVTGASDAPLGATVCRSGFRTGWRCGTLTRNNVSVNYGSGTVSGLRESNACAGQGDSGGSWVAGGNRAQGVTSGGALGGDGTNCGIPQNQRRTWFQRVIPMLNSYGLTLVTN